MEGEHHHNPKKFKIGILKHSMSSKIIGSSHVKGKRNGGRSRLQVSFIESEVGGADKGNQLDE